LLSLGADASKGRIRRLLNTFSRERLLLFLAGSPGVAITGTRLQARPELPESAWCNHVKFEGKGYLRWLGQGQRSALTPYGDLIEVIPRSRRLQSDRAIGFGREIIGSPSGHKKGAIMDWLFFLRPPRLYGMVENDRQFYFQAEAHLRPQEYESDPGPPARGRATTSRAGGCSDQSMSKRVACNTSHATEC
jgi:hypothetical protein